MLKKWTCWEVKELFGFAYSFRIWSQIKFKLKRNKFHCVRNPTIIWPKDIIKGSTFVHGTQLWTFFELKSSMWYALKNKTRGPTDLKIALVVYVYLFKKLAELTLFWFCFNCVDFRHILLSKYLALNNLTPKLFAWKYTVTSVKRIYI